MKKFLSLVLALVMTMSLVTISAGAKDFTDDSSITYEEAIDVMSAVKVIDGYPDGSFKPTTQLNRGQAAKILCNMLLGPTTASALKADSAPFKDVAVDNTFAGYIAYCAQAGIIDGYTDGTFRPTAPLTGYAFMKLLLGALGYDKDVEGYNIPNWSINVAKQALAIGLDDGLKNDFDGTKIVTREEACLYAFNALQADLVEYGSKTTVNVGGAEVVIAGTAAKAVTWNNSATKKTNIKDDNYVQFAEQYFNKLVKTSVTDDFARPATKWTNKGDKIGTYVDTPAKTYNKNVTTGTIYADLNMTQKDKNAEVYVNGVREDDVDIEKNNTAKIADKVNGVKYNYDDTNTNALVGDGSIVEVFYDADKNDVKICVMDVFVGVVTSVDKKADDPFIVINPYNSPILTNTSISKFKFVTDENFAEDDVVLFTYSEDVEEIESVVLAESKEGNLSKIVYSKSVDLNGETLKYSKNVAFEGNENDLTTKTDYVVYLDQDGQMIYIKEKEFNADEYAFVLAVESANQTGFKTNRAKLILADGSLKTVVTDDDYATTNNLLGQIVNYRVDSNNEYVLRKAPNSTFNGAPSTSAAAALTLTINEANPMHASYVGVAKGGVNIQTAGANFQMKNSNAKILPGDGATLYANSETVFVVFDGANFSTYTGIANAPTIEDKDANSTAEIFYYKRGNNLVAFMFIDATGCKITDGSNSIVYLAGSKSVSKLIRDVDNKDYYLYNAVVGGEITTVKVLATQDGGSYLAGLEGKDANMIAMNPSYNNKGMIKSVDNISGSSRYTLVENNIAGIWKLNGKYTIGIGGTTASASVRYTVAPDAMIFRVSTKGEITKIDIADVYSDTNDTVTALRDIQDGDIAFLFIQDVDDNKKEDAGTTPVNLTSIAVAKVSGKLQVTLTGTNVGGEYDVVVSMQKGGVDKALGTYIVKATANNTASNVTTVTLPITTSASWDYTVECGAQVATTV